MSQNRNFLAQTKIPHDPRKRSRGHARVAITLWFDLEPDVLHDENVRDATDLLRKVLESEEYKKQIRSLPQHANKILGYDGVVCVDVSVGK